MKDQFDEETRKALAYYRLERAQQAMAEAAHNAAAGFYNNAINRLYYACFYAVIALFVKNKITTSTHSGAKTMLNLHFVKSGIITREESKTFSTLMESRQSGDYADFVYLGEDDYQRLYPRAKEFIEKVTALII